MALAEEKVRGSGIEPREFRNALGKFATGITVVTVTSRRDDEVRGITVNAFMSLSLAPPLVAVCIDKRANAHARLLESEVYGVSILAAEQMAHSNTFAGAPADGLELAFERLGEAMVLEGALSQLACRVRQIVDAGDHTLFIGEVEALRYREGEPLLYYGGRYATLARE
jgi:flavin reductase (DIM6/NTAB) family NADH-FMN oxidoreductase RutF